MTVVLKIKTFFMKRKESEYDERNQMSEMW